MVIDNGFTPEFAVTAMLPSLLRARPNGCGATSKLLPEGVSSLPLGITVIPSLFIEVYKLPAGAESTVSSFFVDWQEVKIMPDKTMEINCRWKFIFLMLKELS
jgi:hypothetical protein